MSWVRGHYRRRRRGASPDIGGVLLLVLFGAAAWAVVTIVGVVAAVVVVGAEFIARNWLPLSLAALLAAAVPCVLALRSWRRARATARFLRAAGVLADNSATMSADEVDGIIRLRLGVSPLTRSAVVTLEKWFRESVAEVVADRRVTDEERDRLDSLRHAFGLADDVADRAEVEAFMEVYADLVADKRLTETEELQLAELRNALRIPDAAIADQLAFAGRLRDQRLAFEAQLRKAKAVASQSLAPIVTAVRLKAGEVCFYCSPFTEKKERVSRTYVVDGVRRRETQMEDVRSGDLYLTGERLLLVASGTTTIALAKILDHAVDTDSQLLGITVDGRKTPHYLEVPEPLVASAYLERVAREQFGGDA